MLTDTQLDQLCEAHVATGKACPVAQLARDGEIDLGTYARHRIAQKAAIAADRTKQIAAENMARRRT